MAPTPPHAGIHSTTAAAGGGGEEEEEECHKNSPYALFRVRVRVRNRVVFFSLVVTRTNFSSSQNSHAHAICWIEKVEEVDSTNLARHELIIDWLFHVLLQITYLPISRSVPETEFVLF